MNFFRDFFTHGPFLSGQSLWIEHPILRGLYYKQFIFSGIFLSALAAVAVHHDVCAHYNIR
jgi:hypothetical protein